MERGQDFEAILSVTDFWGCFCKSQSSKIKFSEIPLPSYSLSPIPCPSLRISASRTGGDVLDGGFPPRTTQPLSLKTSDSLS